MYDTLYNKKFEVVDLLILLRSIHNVQDGIRIHIPVENINNFQQTLEKKGYECCLKIEDFERFNTNDVERFKNTGKKVFEIDDNIIKITFNQRVISDYRYWNFDVNSIPEIKKSWYEAMYNIKITTLSTSEIDVGDYFLYNNKLYKCCEDDGYTECSECSFYDNDNENCPITNNTIKKCCWGRNDKKWVHYCEIKPFEFNDNTIVYVSSNPLLKKIETPNSIDDSNDNLKNCVTLDKITSALADEEVKKIQEKLIQINKFVNLIENEVKDIILILK